MINKQNLWVITLFSLIVILCIYYFSLPNNTISAFDENAENITESVEITESDVIVAMKVEEDEKILSQMTTAQETLLNASASIEEKNKAYNTLQKLNLQKGKMDSIEKAIKENFQVESCIKINGNTINVILQTTDQGTSYVNKVIQTVQSFYNDQMYITVEFQK